MEDVLKVYDARSGKDGEMCEMLHPAPLNFRRVYIPRGIASINRFVYAVCGWLYTASASPISSIFPLFIHQDTVADIADHR